MLACDNFAEIYPLSQGLVGALRGKSTMQGGAKLLTQARVNVTHLLRQDFRVILHGTETNERFFHLWKPEGQSRQLR